MVRIKRSCRFAKWMLPRISSIGNGNQFRYPSHLFLVCERAAAPLLQVLSSLNAGSGDRTPARQPVQSFDEACGGGSGADV